MFLHAVVAAKKRLSLRASTWRCLTAPEPTRRASNAKSKIRSRVEHVFADQKTRIGFARATAGSGWRTSSTPSVGGSSFSGELPLEGGGTGPWAGVDLHVALSCTAVDLGPSVATSKSTYQQVRRSIDSPLNYSPYIVSHTYSNVISRPPLSG